MKISILNYCFIHANNSTVVNLTLLHPMELIPNTLKFNHLGLLILTHSFLQKRKRKRKIQHTKT